MTIQIDIKPEQENPHSRLHEVNIYMFDSCYKLYASRDQISSMLADGIIKAVKGKRHEQGKLVEFDYENGVDSAGIKYTSDVYQMEKTSL